MHGVIGIILLVSKLYATDTPSDFTTHLMGELSIAGRTNMYKFGSNLNRYQIVSNLSLGASKKFEKFTATIISNLGKELTHLRESQINDIKIGIGKEIDDIVVAITATSYLGSELYRLTTTYLGLTLNGRMSFEKFKDLGLLFVLTKNFSKYNTNYVGIYNKSLILGMAMNYGHSFLKDRLFTYISGGISTHLNEHNRFENTYWNYSLALEYFLFENLILNLSFMHDAGLYSYDGRSFNTRFIAPDEMTAEFIVSYRFGILDGESIWEE